MMSVLFLILWCFVLPRTDTNIINDDMIGDDMISDDVINDDTISRPDDQQVQWNIVRPPAADLKRFEPTFNVSNASRMEGNPLIKKFLVTAVLEPPFVMLKETSHYIAGNDRFEGFLVDLLRHIATSLDFDYEIRLANDNKYGDLYLDRYWDGMIGEVHRMKADIAMGPLIMTNVTRRFVDFTEPLLSLRYSALIRKPKKNIRETLDKSSNSSGKKASMLEDGGELIIRDVSQLVASGMTCGVVRDSLAYKMLTNSTLPEHRIILSRLAQSWPTAFVRNRQEGVARARGESYAFIIDTPIAEYEAGKHPCDLYTTEPFLDLVEYALALSKGATIERESGEMSLKKAMDEEIMKLKRGDDMQMMYLHWWKDECMNYRDGDGGEEEDGDDYNVFEWNEDDRDPHKGTKPHKVKYKGHLPLFGRTVHRESNPHLQLDQHDQVYLHSNSTHHHGNKPIRQNQHRSASRRYNNSKSNSESISTALLLLTMILTDFTS